MCQLRVYSMQPSEPRPAVYLFTGCTPYLPARLQPASRARRAQQMRGPLCSLRSNRRRISWELTPSRLHAARGLHPCTPARRRDCYTLSCGDGRTDGPRERQRVYDLWAAQRSLMCDRPRPSVREREPWTDPRKCLTRRGRVWSAEGAKNYIRTERYGGGSEAAARQRRH